MSFPELRGRIDVRPHTECSLNGHRTLLNLKKLSRFTGSADKKMWLLSENYDRRSVVRTREIFGLDRVIKSEDE